MTTTRLVWKLRKFATRWALQTSCVGGGGEELNFKIWVCCRSPIMGFILPEPNFHTQPLPNRNFAVDKIWLFALWKDVFFNKTQHQNAYCMTIYPNWSKADKWMLTRFYKFTVMAHSSPHYTDVIMTTMASQITSLTVVYSTIYLDADQRKHQSSASLAFVWGIHRDRWIPRT